MTLIKTRTPTNVLAADILTCHHLKAQVQLLLLIFSAYDSGAPLPQPLYTHILHQTFVLVRVGKAQVATQTTVIFPEMEAIPVKPLQFR